MGRATRADGWRFVGGIAAAFRDHGLCATESWIVTPEQSFLRQGNVRDGWHANGTGRAVLADALVAAGSLG